MNRDRMLKKIGVIADTLGIMGLHEMGFNIPRTSLKARYVVELMKK